MCLVVGFLVSGCRAWQRRDTDADEQDGQRPNGKAQLSSPAILQNGQRPGIRRNPACPAGQGPSTNAATGWPLNDR